MSFCNDWKGMDYWENKGEETINCHYCHQTIVKGKEEWIQAGKFFFHLSCWILWVENGRKT